MLKVKINDEWIEAIKTLAWNEQTLSWEVSYPYGFNSGQIQDIKWVEERQEEIERTPVSNDYREQMRGDMYDIKTLGAKLDEVIEAAKDADGILNQYAPITRRVIESLKRCKVILRYGVGVDNIDVEAATERGIIIANVPDYCIDEVSTHTMALILACARGITLLDRKRREKKWDFTLAKPLFRTKGKNLGLFGLGRIARMVAQKASRFGFKIIAYDPYIPKLMKI